jgi:hypothetical protein
MQDDIGETTNLFESKPEIVNQLLDLLKADIERGRSTAGPDSANDFPDIVLWKSEKVKKKKSDGRFVPQRGGGAEGQSLSDSILRILCLFAPLR